jgi:hypothetical protein
LGIRTAVGGGNGRKFANNTAGFNRSSIRAYERDVKALSKYTKSAAFAFQVESLEDGSSVQE